MKPGLQNYGESDENLRNHLTLFFPMFPFDTLKTSENLAFLKARYAHVCTCAYQGVRNARCSDVFRGIHREHWEEKG